MDSSDLYRRSNRRQCATGSTDQYKRDINHTFRDRNCDIYSNTCNRIMYRVNIYGNGNSDIDMCRGYNRDTAFKHQYVCRNRECIVYGCGKRFIAL